MTTFSVKWHWLAGGLSILLFGFLLAIRLDVFAPAQSVPGPAATLVQGDRTEDAWMAILQEGRKIGYSHRTLNRTDQGWRLQESVLMRINTMGVVQDLRLKTTGDLHPDMTLSSFTFDLQSSLFRFVARGEVRGRQATVYYGLPAEEKRVDLTLKAPPRLSNSIFDSLRGKTMQAGQDVTLTIFDPSTMAERPVKVTVLDQEIITIMGQPQKARKVAVDFMGAKQLAWVGENGAVLKEKGLLGMTLEKVSREKALDGFDLAASADLTLAASILAGRTIDHPDALKTLTVRLDKINPENLSLAGDRQRYRHNVLTIEKETLPASFSPAAVLPEQQPFLKAGPFIQSDDREIRRLARHIVSGEGNEVIKARKLMVWVYQNVEKRPVLSIPNALQTLRNRVGDCNEHAALLAALGRAAGIPTQIEAGLVYQRGRFFYHAWNVFYLGKWITADAVLGQMPADVTHIRLVRGEADRQIDLMGAIGQLNLEIKDMSK